MLSSVRLTDLDPLQQNGSTTLDHIDRNASGDWPYINNTPYVITLRLYIQFWNNSQIQLRQQQATQDILLVSPLRFPYDYLDTRAVFLQVSGLHLQSEAVPYKKRPATDWTRRWPEIAPRRKVGCSHGLSDKLGFEWCKPEAVTEGKRRAEGISSQLINSERTTLRKSRKGCKRVTWECWQFSWKRASDL